MTTAERAELIGEHGIAQAREVVASMPTPTPDQLDALRNVLGPVLGRAPRTKRSYRGERPAA